MKKTLSILGLLAATTVGMVGAGCSSAAKTPSGDALEALKAAQADEYTYLTEERIEAFNRNLGEFRDAALRMNTEAEAAIRSQLTQNAVAYEQALINAIGDIENPRARATAAFMFGFLGKGESALTLAQIMTNPDEPSFMRNRASIGLAVLGKAINQSPDREAVMALVSMSMLPSNADTSVRIHSLMAYARAYDSRLGDSLESLKRVVVEDYSNEVRIQALVELGDLGIEARTAVTEIGSLLRDPDIAVRAAAAQALGLIPDPTAYAQLYTATEDPAVRVRREAVYAMVGQRAVNIDGVRDRLVRGLGDTDESVRTSAAAGARMLGDSELIKPLLSSLSDASVNVRLEAISALGQIVPREEQKKAIHLVWSLDDGNPSIRGAAHSALKRITGETIAADPEAWRGWFYQKYPNELDPDVVYKGVTKPRSYPDANRTGGNAGIRPSTRTNTRTTRQPNRPTTQQQPIRRR